MLFSPSRPHLALILLATLNVIPRVVLADTEILNFRFDTIGLSQDKGYEKGGLKAWDNRNECIWHNQPLRIGSQLHLTSTSNITSSSNTDPIRHAPDRCFLILPNKRKSYLPQTDLHPSQKGAWDWNWDWDWDWDLERLSRWIGVGNVDRWNFGMYTVRVSWPATYPAKFKLSVFKTPPPESIPFILISTSFDSVPIPFSSPLRLSSSPSLSFLPSSHHTSNLTSQTDFTPFIIILEPLLLGFIPQTAVKTGLALVVMGGFGWVISGGVIVLLEGLVGRQDEARKKKMD